jgi:hypothetical protein
MIEWVPAAFDGAVTRVDIDAMTVTAPRPTASQPQTAGRIARESGLAGDDGWCPIEAETMRSTLDPDIHVIGDTAAAGDMPKSAYSDNSHAKGAVKVGAHYEATAAGITTVGAFVSTIDEDPETRARSMTEADAWYDGITADIFG